MTRPPEILILNQVFAVCRTHIEALKEVLEDLGRRALTAPDLDNLSKEDRLLDQFAYRYTRLQDDMGARLIPAALRALGEEIAAMSVLDRLDRMEQLGWLTSAEEWGDLRRIRNEFTHEYPETAEERLEKLQLALTSARRLLEIFGMFAYKIDQRVLSRRT